MAHPVRSADHPIAGREEDLLNRADLGELLAREIQDLDATHGFVVGILGDWGSGKTSLINMVVEQLEASSVSVLEFNPWLFSGTEQLVTTFFGELAAQLRARENRLESIAEKLETYGDALSPLRFIPFLGSWLDKAGALGAVVGRVLNRRAKERGSVLALRKSLANELSQIDRPLVVIVDDLDRLRSEEIREVFKLIRLTGSFPNLVYVVAFDRRRVEKALEDEGISGRAYLEKILQFAYDIPPVPREALQRLLIEALLEAVEPIEAGPFDEILWPDVFMECVWPYIRNLRDVKRYLASLPLSLRHLGDHVALVDAIAAEALRVFSPEAHRLLPATSEALTTTSDAGYGTNTDADHRAKVLAFVEAGGENQEAVRSLCMRVFPATERYLGGTNYGSDWLPRWSRERRLAHPDVLAYYIDRTLTQGIRAARYAERAFAALDNEDALQGVFAGLSAEEAELTVAALEAFEADFPAEGVESACRVLLNLLPRLRIGTRGMFDFGADTVVRRVVLRLLRRLEPGQIELVTNNLLTSIETYHGRYVLLNLVGHRDNAGHKLISEDAARALEADLGSAIARASPEELVAERELLRLIWWATHLEDGPPQTIPAVSSPEVQNALLRSSLTATRSQSVGSRAVRREKRLAWDVLVEALGGEDVVREVVGRLRDTDLDEELQDAVDLADRYLVGWRPDEL